MIQRWFQPVSEGDSFWAGGRHRDSQRLRKVLEFPGIVK
jgi:hypothetical protein